MLAALKDGRNAVQIIDSWTQYDSLNTHLNMPMLPFELPTHYNRKSMRSMHRDMAVIYSNDADKDFAALMIPHHQGALEMAQTELKYGKDPELRELAQQIVDAQQKEIALMRAWQAKQPK